MPEFAAGETLTAEKLNRSGVKMRGRRITAGTTTTTAIQGFLRLDDCAILAGRHYRIQCTGVHPQSTVASDAIQWDILYTTDGSTPTTASAVLGGTEGFVRAVVANSAESRSWGTTYSPVGNETLSLLFVYKRIAGTGNVHMFASTAAAFEMAITDTGGLDPGNTGTSI